MVDLLWSTTISLSLYLPICVSVCLSVLSDCANAISHVWTLDGSHTPLVGGALFSTKLVSGGGATRDNFKPCDSFFTDQTEVARGMWMPCFEFKCIVHVYKEQTLRTVYWVNLLKLAFYLTICLQVTTQGDLSRIHPTPALEVSLLLCPMSQWQQTVVCMR